MKAGAEGDPSAPAFFISFYSRNRSMGCRRQACKRAQIVALLHRCMR